MINELPDSQEESLDKLFERFSYSENRSEVVQRNPFKFLDSYSLEDKDIFFGRDKEIDELYRKFYQQKILLVYGQSGTGKSSIVNCGLLSRIPSRDIYKIDVRCSRHPVGELLKEINTHLSFISNSTLLSDRVDNLLDIPADNIISGLAKIYSKHYKPIVLFFDQFEEIFIFSNRIDRKEFSEVIKLLIESKLNVSLVFMIREEYYAGLTEFEPVIPQVFANRIRIEKIDSANAKKVIENPCEICDVIIENGVSDYIINQLKKEDGTMELTYIQIIMDKLYREALNGNSLMTRISLDSVKKMNNLDNILSDFLNDQIAQLDNSLEVEMLLKALISSDGTKVLLLVSEVAKKLSGSGLNFNESKITQILQQLINLRIIKEKDDQGRFELKHDSLALAIFNRMSIFEKEFLEIRQMFENRYNDYVKRKLLLDSSTLESIIPYQKKLNLNDDQQEFLYNSRVQIESLRKEAEKKERKIKELETLKKINGFERLLEERTSELLDKNRDITASIIYASRIQRAFFPSEKLLNESGFVLLYPKEIGSGDFYWIQRTNNSLILIAADCTGHGVPGAIMSIMGLNLIKTEIVQSESPESDMILNKLRDKFNEMLFHKDIMAYSNDTMDLSMVVINLESHEAQYSGAQMPIVLIRDGQITDFKPDRQPIGYSEEMKPFTKQIFNLERDDMLYLYTDGFADQFGGVESKKFKNNNLKKLFQEIHKLPMNKQRERLEFEFNTWKGDKGQVDDMLIVGYRI